MGIHGLRSFIERKEILQPYTLRDTRVVVDGKNICYQLLNKGTCRHYGGDYTAFKSESFNFFQRLLQCDVQPFVVFDGTHYKGDKKIKDIQNKGDARIKEYEKTMPPNMECTPPLLYESFTMVLKQLKIPHLACEGEVDNQIAVLAKQWGCPVISSDTDMYIFDLPGGVIYFSDLWPTNNQRGDLYTQLYLASTFERKTGLSASFLPLAATILVNAYVDIYCPVVHAFFQRLGATETLHDLAKNVEYAFDLIKRAGDKDHGFSLLMECLNQKLSGEKASELKREINTSITFYSLIDEFQNYNIADVFIGNGKVRQHQNLPDSVMQSIQSCSLSRLPIDIVIGRVILKPTLEEFGFPPIQEIFLQLRQIVYGIVLKSCSMETQTSTIVEIIRENRQMTQKHVFPKFEIKGYGPVPTLQYVDELDNDGKIKILSFIYGLQPELLLDIPEESKLFILALNYFSRHGLYEVEVFKLKSYILCHIMLLNKENKPEIREAYDQICSSVSNTHKNLEIFHRFLQRFQEGLNMAYTINVLVGTPVQQPDPATVYHGLFMYNFFCQNQSDDCVEQSVRKCIGAHDQLKQLYETMVCKFMTI